VWAADHGRRRHTDRLWPADAVNPAIECDDRADFSQDYLASQALLSGQTLYNPEFYNNHPPFDMLLILPLALLSYHTAFLIWSALALLCYGAVGLIVARELNIALAPHWVALAVGLALCWSPFQERMALGQMWVRPLLVAPGLATRLTRLASLGLLIVLARQTWRAPKTGRGDDLTFAAVCVAMLLISPLTWQHTFMLLLLPFGLLLRELLDRPNWRGTAVSLLALALVSSPNIDIARALIGLYKPDRLSWFAALPLIAPTAGLLLIWWLLVARSRFHRVA